MRGDMAAQTFVKMSPRHDRAIRQITLIEAGTNCSATGAKQACLAREICPMSAVDFPLLYEPVEVYHQKASEYLTSHQLADFRRCPLLYQKKKLGLVEEEDRAAFLVGRALHTLVLEGQEAFSKQYAVGGPVNPRTGQPFGPNTKAFAQWAAEQGKPVLTTAQLELVDN
ncbi:hypothetical protein D6833_09375, partial [Candidatus Parcubacteria bacterium]